MNRTGRGGINLRGGFNLADYGYEWTLKDIIIDQFCDHCQVWVTPTKVERQETDTGSWTEVTICPNCGCETSKTEEIQ